MTRSIVVIACTLCLACNQAPEPEPAQPDCLELAHPVIIDTDLAMGLPLADVDDGLALSAALASTELDVIGITTVYGNACQPAVARQVAQLLDLADRSELPILAGARSPDELGAETEASRFLVEQLHRCPGRITLLALGPLTNVATVLNSDPDAAELLDELYAMGGAVRIPGNVQEQSEFNFWHDPIAARDVLDLAQPTLTPLDITTTVRLDEEFIEQLRERDNAVARSAAQLSERWLDLQRSFGEDSFAPHDVLPVLMAEEPGLFRFEQLSLQVDLGELDREPAETLRCDDALRTVQTTQPGRGQIRIMSDGNDLRVAMSVDPQAVRERLLDRLGHF